jgi:hypothetical protein
MKEINQQAYLVLEMDMIEARDTMMNLRVHGWM